MTPARRAGAAGAAGVLLLAAVAALGDSAAVPGLGPATAHPPWDLAAALGRTGTSGSPALAPSWLVSTLIATAYLLAAGAVWQGLVAVREGWRPRPRRVAAAGVGAVVLLTLVPPMGSADHLSYLAYGRIAAAGDDPYVQSPIEWRGGLDPVAGAVQPPWQSTPSIYGPVATAAFAAAATLGGGSLRAGVWWWQLLCAGAFLAVAAALDRLTRADPALRARAAMLWLLNPLLLGHLVLGAHVDVLAAAFAVGALAAGRRRPLLAGALAGVAAAVKLPYGLVGVALLLGVLWPAGTVLNRAGLNRAGLNRAGLNRAGLLVAGGLTAVVPTFALAGPHVLDQLGTASGFTSIASPWRALVNLAELWLGSGVRRMIVPLALLAALTLAWAIERRLRTSHDQPHPAGPDEPGARTARIALALTAGWILTAPYALPWYDAMVWAPLALVAAPRVLEGALLARLLALGLAYLPGRVIGMSATVEALTLGLRRYVAPVLVLSCVLAVVVWAAGRGRGRLAPPPPAVRRPPPSPPGH